MASTHPTTVRLKDENREHMERFARLTKRSHSHIINEALEAYFPDRLAYLNELGRAVEEIKTQPSFSADEVFSWMDTWGTKDEKTLAQANLTPIAPSK